MRLPCTIVEDPFDIDFSAVRDHGELVVFGVSLVPASGVPVEVPDWLRELLLDHLHNSSEVEEMVE